jgi:hypothetical protein
VLVVYALDARSYALLVLTSLLSVWALGALLERADRPRFALWALAAAATVWTHYFGGFLVLAEVVVLLWLRPAARRGTIVAAAGALLAILPLLPLLRDQTGDERAGFIAGSGLAGRVEGMVREFATGPNVPRTWLEALGLALFLCGAAAGTAIVLRRAPPRAPGVRIARGAAPAAAAPAPAAAAPREEPVGGVPEADGARALLGLLAIGLAVPLVLALLGLYDRFFMRNLLFLLPLAAALVATGLLRLRALPLAAYLAVCVTAVVWVHGDWRYEQTDWRDAIAAVRAGDARAGAAAPVIAVTDLGQPVAAHYLRSRAAAAPIGTRRAWLVVEPRRGPGQRALHPLAPTAADAALAAQFPSRRERVVNGFRVVELRAPAPVALAPGALPGATLFEPAR